MEEIAARQSAEAFAFSSLVQHLRGRLDTQNIELMILGGFCRNCLAKWYLAGAWRAGLHISYDEACERVYGMPYSEWKKRHQGKATDEQLRRLEESQPGHAKHATEDPPAVPHAALSHPAALSAAEVAALAESARAQAKGDACPLHPPTASPASNVCCTPAEELIAPPPEGFEEDRLSAPVPSLLALAPSLEVAPPPGLAELRVAVLTVSDRAAAGVYADISGAEVQRCLRAYAAGGGASHWNLRIVSTAVVPDEVEQISETLRAWADRGEVNVVLTTGGTGLAPRDVTPEATMAVLSRPLPGLSELLMRAALSHEPLAALSRSAAGTRGRCLIVNLPGRPRAVVQNMGTLMPLLAHAVLELCPAE
jgi:molybdenum cofactor synthesis domain-containing protein